MASGSPGASSSAAASRSAACSASAMPRPASSAASGTGACPKTTTAPAQPRRRFRQAAQVDHDGVHDRLGQQPADPVRGLVGRQHRVGAQHREQLFEQERVAAAHVRARPAERVRSVGEVARADQVADRRLREHGRRRRSPCARSRPALRAVRPRSRCGSQANAAEPGLAGLSAVWAEKAQGRPVGQHRAYQRRRQGGGAARRPARRGSPQAVQAFDQCPGLAFAELRALEPASGSASATWSGKQRGFLRVGGTQE